MKTIAYTALHYGSDYLAYAIRSVIDHIDEYWVLYAAEGSHGYRTPLPCPDTRDELFRIAERAAGRKLRWIDGSWPYEGAQREHIHKVAPDADVILVLDADEVWSPYLAQYLIADYANMGSSWTIHRLRVPIIHYWRSFYRCVLHDPAFPERLVFPKVTGNYIGTASPPKNYPINHFGYAQRPEIVEYKQHTHGHKGEWRRDCDWFHDRFMANAQTDCHPVGSEYWNPEAIDPWEFLPDFMREHPYANLQVIE